MTKRHIDMAEINRSDDMLSGTTVAFGQEFASSDAFKTLFREGMALVEDAAAYLDVEGRDDVRRLPRLIALSYANESMRLTTRLMQVASWLLLQRAVAEGEVSPTEAQRQHRKVRPVRPDLQQTIENRDGLPPRLVELVEQSLRLQSRIAHLDSAMTTSNEDLTKGNARNAVALQRMLLNSAFGGHTPD